MPTNSLTLNRIKAEMDANWERVAPKLAQIERQGLLGARREAAEAFAALLRTEIAAMGDDFLGALVNHANSYTGAVSPVVAKDAQRIVSAGMDVDGIAESFEVGAVGLPRGRRTG